jgi:GH24 family phage-related lysozyme (muramidase)
MQKFYGDSTHWGIGVVEDIQDPLNQGRVRVRIHGLHTFDTNKLAAHELPWSAVAIPANNAGTSGIGQTPTGLVENSFVFGIFLDGEDKQDFLVTNALTGTDTATARQGQLINQITSSLYGDSNPERMYSYFRDILGFTEEEAGGALGAVAQFMGDYTLNDVDVDHGEGRYGIGNWDEDATAALRQFASGTGRDYKEFDTQLLFLGNGLQHSDSWPNYSEAGQQLGALDASQAADSFAVNVLRLPLDQERRVRHAHARQALDAYGSSTTGDIGLFPSRGAPTDLVTGTVLPSEEHVYRYIRSLDRHIAELIVTDTNTQPGTALADDWADETHFLITEDGAIQIGTLANQPVENMPAGSSVTADGEMLRASRFTTSTEMRTQIKTWEGIRLEPYVDAHGYAIGYGYFIGTDDQPELFEAFSERWMGTATSDRSQISITRAQADELFDETIERFERIVQNAVNVDITQSQFDALVSFTYNLGGFSGAQTLIGNLNSGNYVAAADAFTLYANSTNENGELIRLDGLYSRRLVESEYFRRGLVGVNGVTLRNHRQFSIVVTFQGGQRRGGGRATTYTNEQFNALRAIAGASSFAYPAVSIIGLRDLDETSNRPLFDVRQFFESTSPNTTSNPQAAPATVSDTSGVQGSSASAGGEAARPATAKANAKAVNSSKNSPSVEPDVPTPNADHTPTVIDLDTDVVETATGEIADLSAPTPPTSIPSPFLDPILGVVGSSSGLGLDLSALAGDTLTEAEVQALIDGSLVAYYTSSQVDTLLTSYYTSSQVDTLLAARDELGELTDVTLTSPSTGQYLRYNGADWVNATIDYADITGTPGSGTFVDLVSDQSIDGEKTFTDTIILDNSLSSISEWRFYHADDGKAILTVPGTGNAEFTFFSNGSNYANAQMQIGGNTVWHAGNLASTTNLPEGTNLYYTHARFDSAFGAKSTTDLGEGSNLYYTQARFDTAFGAKSTTDLGEGSNLYYTNARANAAIDARVDASFVNALGVNADTVDNLHASSFVRGDNVNNGATTIVVNDADFILADNTDPTTNWFWRDHSAGSLLIGSPDAVPTLRHDMNVNGKYLLSVQQITGTTGGLNVTVNDSDFTVRDATDATTNYIWRDHSANLLYLGSPAAEVTFRSDVDMNGQDLSLPAGSTIDFTDRVSSDPGADTLINLGGVPILRQVSDRGALNFSSKDDSLILGCGDVGNDFHTLITNENAENVWVVADGSVYVVTDLQNGYDSANRQFRFGQDGEFYVGSDQVYHTGNDDQIAFLNAASQTFTGNMIVSGNLTVNGTQTVLNTTELTIDDNIILLNAGETGVPSLAAGIEVERGTSPNVRFRWNETTDTWQGTVDGSNYYDVLFDDGTAAGDAATLDGLDSSQFIRSDVTDAFTTSTSSYAYMQSNVSTSATQPGYLSWHDPGGTRRGYLGWSYGTSGTRFETENGYGFFFSGTEEVAFVNDLGVSIGTTASASSLGVALYVNGDTGLDHVAEFSRSDDGDHIELDGSGYSTFIGQDASRTYIRNNSAARGLALGVNSQNNFRITAGGNSFEWYQNDGTRIADLDTNGIQAGPTSGATNNPNVYLNNSGDLYAQVMFRTGTTTNAKIISSVSSGTMLFDASGGFTWRDAPDGTTIATLSTAGDFEIGGKLTVSGSDPYVKTDANNKHVVFSGGSGWTSTGATITARGASSATNSGGLEFRGATTGSRALQISGFTSETIDGSQIATESWVTSQGYITSASGGDAATLDGLDSSQFLRSDQDDQTTGRLRANGNLISGLGSGGVGLTINDGYGNANLTFNHEAGIPEQNGNAARIVVNTDDTTDAHIDFQVKTNVTGGAATGLTSVMQMRETGLRLLDSKILSLGTSDDMEIFHGGANNFIDLNLGDLYVRDGTTIRFTFNRTSGNLNAIGGFTVGGTATSLDTSGLTLAAGDIINHNNTSSRDKIRVWNNSDYSIGMDSAFTYGYLNDYAMTFQMNNDTDRGFWWGHNGHTKAQGAMSLTTDGRLYVDQLIQVNGNTVWHAGNDGSGSGLNADLLDGNHASAFALLSGATFTGTVNVENTSISGKLIGLKGAGSTNGVYHGFFSGDYYIVNVDNERIVFGTNNTTRGYIDNNGALVWNDRGTSIAGATWENGWVKIGTSGLGWSIDNNEIYNASDSTIGTLSGDLNLDAAVELNVNSDMRINSNVAIGNSVQSTRALYVYRDGSSATDTDEFATYSYMRVTGTPSMTGDRSKYGAYCRSILADSSTTSDSNVAALNGVFGYGSIEAGHSDNVFGVHGLAAVNGGADSNAGNMYGGNFEARLDNAGSSATTMQGVMGRLRTTADSDGAITTGYGVRSFFDHDGTGTISTMYLFAGQLDIEAATGTISTLYGMHLNLRDSVDGTITNRRGIWVEAPDTQNSVRNHIQGHTVFGGNSASFITNDATVWIDDNQTTGTGLLVTGGGTGGSVARFRRDVGGTSEIIIHHSNADPTIAFDAVGTGTGDWSIGLTDADNFIINNANSPSTGTAELRLDAGAHYLYLDDKEAIRYGDSWLRLNNSQSFTSGIYCGSSTLRTDGTLQVGSGGSALNATTSLITIGATMRFKDSVIASFGTGNDFEIFHNGTDNYIDLNVGNLYVRNGTTTRFTFARSTGDFTATGNVTANSDRNLKDILSPVWDSNIIDSLNVVNFAWKSDGKLSRGVIAQDVEMYAPWFVVTGENGIKSVDYGKLATAAVYEEKKKREALEEKVEKLEAMVEMLMEKLNGSTE